MDTPGGEGEGEKHCWWTERSKKRKMGLKKGDGTCTGKQDKCNKLKVKTLNQPQQG